MRIHALLAAFAASILASPVAAGESSETPPDPFRQFQGEWRSPNVYRTASGAPGPQYWQQRADYEIAVTLDAENRRLEGEATLTYTNNAPQSLSYLWLQLDQNRFSQDSQDQRTRTQEPADSMSFSRLRSEMLPREQAYGHRVESVTDAGGREMETTIRDTLMRVELDAPLETGESLRLKIAWSYRIPKSKAIGARTGFEYFDANDNDLYFIAQWFPRPAAFTDTGGWQVKQFLGRGEWALEFGDYDVAITVPADYIVAATGELQNPRAALTGEQRQRLGEARDSKEPVYIVTPEEARDNQEEAASGTQTWRFTAERVRDFAFAASRKFIWQAQGVALGDGRTVMAMSYFPEEGSPLWDKYSVPAIAQALETYSRMSQPYPYPKAIAVNGPIGGGMEYPMISSNGPRPEPDGTYSRDTKYGLISVIIHETGHNFFPMIVNSNERQWYWMDEGLNSFLQFLAEREWEEDYPADRGKARAITEYMAEEEERPVMTASDSASHVGESQYAKPATALNILRETILGRELFDKAFKEYAERWWFKRPTPEDFFRTMEDAAGRDLDWFWRDWFYGTEHVDIALSKVTRASIDTQDPETEAAYKREREAESPRSVTAMRNEGIARRVEAHPELLDFYNEQDEHTVTEAEREEYQQLLEDLAPWQEELLDLDSNLYFLEFTNEGGVVMPLILEITYADGSSESRHIPAEIWRYDPNVVSKLIITDKTIETIVLDPHQQTADADTYDNRWPRKPAEKRIELERDAPEQNLMQEMGHEPEEQE